MEKKQYIKNLQNKDEIQDTFLVKHIAVMEARDGRSYLNVILADKTGEMEARMWTNAEETAEQVKRGEFADVKGRMNLFQGRLQIIINSIQSREISEEEKSHFVEKSDKNSEQMYDELYEIVEQLEEVYIRDLLKLVLGSPDISSRLKKWQAGKTIHHAYESGLLEHILSCCRLGLFLSSHYKVNRSYVVAGCILHDLCKIYELTNGNVVDYTDEGKLVGHLVKGIEIVDRFAYKINNFPYGVRMHLKHIILAHHGEYEYGSPKIPQTREAYLVHLVDYMDSKMNALETVIKKDTLAGNWTGYQKTMDRIIFKGEIPSYTSYVEKNESAENRSEKKPEQKPEQKPEKRSATPKNKDLKQNLGSLLKDFKVSESSD